MNKKNAILFLGSGATAASGITRESKKLPTDGGFFDSYVVQKLVPVAGLSGYPALQAARKCFKLQSDGLCATWRDLFMVRSFSRSGVLESQTTIDPAELTPRNGPGQHQHYKCQKEIFTWDWPNATRLAELGIWDLRVLVKEVYGGCEQPDRNCYRWFWERLKNHVVAVVNLNYDTTFDESVCEFICGDLEPGCGLHYVGNNSARQGIPIIRPHGSLRWTTSNKWSLEKKGWSCRSWPSNMHDTPLEQLGYRNTGDAKMFTFRQSLIVTPEDFKETVVGNSSMPGLVDPILKIQWQELSKEAEMAQHWLFFGLSLASGDEHLVFLLRHLGNKISPTLHVSCYRHPSCESCVACRIATRLASNKLCIHPIQTSLVEFVDSAPAGCLLKS